MTIDKRCEKILNNYSKKIYEYGIRNLHYYAILKRNFNTLPYNCKYISVDDKDKQQLVNELTLTSSNELPEDTNIYA